MQPGTRGPPPGRPGPRPAAALDSRPVKTGSAPSGSSWRSSRRRGCRHGRGAASAPARPPACPATSGAASRTRRVRYRSGSGRCRYPGRRRGLWPGRPGTGGPRPGRHRDIGRPAPVQARPPKTGLPPRRRCQGRFRDQGVQPGGAFWPLLPRKHRKGQRRVSCGMEGVPQDRAAAARPLPPPGRRDELEHLGAQPGGDVVDLTHQPLREVHETLLDQDLRVGDQGPGGRQPHAIGIIYKSDLYNRIATRAAARDGRRALRSGCGPGDVAPRPRAGRGRAAARRAVIGWRW